LPRTVRVSVRDAGTGQVLAVSSAAIVHINVPAECARAKNAVACVAARSNPAVDKKEEQL
jgi:general secretion pathway protein J